jgi:hypothetical protein
VQVSVEYRSTGECGLTRDVERCRHACPHFERLPLTVRRRSLRRGY